MEESEPMRSSTSLWVAIFSIFALSLLAVSSANAVSNCQDKLIGKSYTCEMNEEGGVEETITFEFVTGGLSEDFDLVIEPATHYGCVCESKGSVNNPSYDSSSSAFMCESSFGFMAVGKVNGKKITGQGTNAAGTAPFIFACKEM